MTMLENAAICSVLRFRRADGRFWRLDDTTALRLATGRASGCALDCTIYPLRNGLIGRNRQFSQSFIGLSAIAIFVLIGFYTSGVIQHFIDSHGAFWFQNKQIMS